jgi:hypothetical protein
MRLSGAARLRDCDAREYRDYVVLSGGHEFDAPHRDQVNKDLPRTFPDDPRFELRFEDIEKYSGNGTDVWSVSTNSLIPALQRVLMAICARRPSPGYTQGLNFVTATLLKHVNEETAFWVTAAIMELSMAQFYTNTLVGTVVENQLIEEVVESELPMVHAALTAEHLSTQIFTTQWVMTLYSMEAKEAIAARLFDVLLSKSIDKCMFLRFSLVMLKMREADILASCGDTRSFIGQLKTIVKVIACVLSGMR